MKFIQTNKKELKKSGNYELVFQAHHGSYGYYAQSTYIKKSKKRMEKEGFILVEEQDERVSKLNSLSRKRKARLEKIWKEKKLKERAIQIELCLKTAAIPIQENEYFGNGLTPVKSVVNLAGTSMIEAYTGCGKGTAYVRKNKLVAFHYGYDQPSNAPLNTEIHKVELSSTQICFI